MIPDKREEEDDARVRRMSVRVSRHAARCNHLIEQLDAVSDYWNATPSRFKGWPAEIVIVVTFLAFLAELFTTQWLVQIIIHFQDTDRLNFALVLTACTIGIGVTLGETLYHRRIDPEQDIIQRLSIVGVAIIAVAYLGTAWALHFTRAAAGSPNTTVLVSGLEATTVAIVGVIVLVVPLVVSYHREAWSTAATRWRRALLRWRLAIAQRNLERAYYERAELL